MPRVVNVDEKPALASMTAKPFTAPDSLAQGGRRNAEESNPSSSDASTARAALVADAGLAALSAFSAESARAARRTFASFDSLICFPLSVFLFSFLPAIERFLMFLPLIFTAA